MKRGSVWFGAILILVGALLLLDRFRVLSFEWPAVFWTGLVLLAGVMLVRHFKGGGGGVFWWTVLLLFSSYRVMKGFELISPPDSVGLPAVLLMFGAGFLVMVAANRKSNWHLLVPAIVLIALGAIILLSELGYMMEADARAFVRDYWPVALILFGAALLLSWRGRSSKA